MAARIGIMGWAALALGFAGPAMADGEFLQVDIANRNQSAVATVARGPIGYGLNFTDYSTGRSASVSVTYTLPTDLPVTLKLGPTVGFQRDEDGSRDTSAGLRMVAERYTPAGFGSTYLLADLSTVHRSWFLLGQATYAPAGIGVELSRGGSDSYHETTLALQKRLGDGPVSLRLGYKLSSEELFAGFSINTF